MRGQIEAGNDAQVIAATTQGPVKIGMCVRVDINNATVSQNDLDQSRQILEQ